VGRRSTRTSLAGTNGVTVTISESFDIIPSVVSYVVMRCNILEIYEGCDNDSNDGSSVNIMAHKRTTQENST
jgi:hypothetical protein